MYPTSRALGVVSFNSDSSQGHLQDALNHKGRGKHDLALCSAAQGCKKGKCLYELSQAYRKDNCADMDRVKDCLEHAAKLSHFKATLELIEILYEEDSIFNYWKYSSIEDLSKEVVLAAGRNDSRSEAQLSMLALGELHLKYGKTEEATSLFHHITVRIPETYPLMQQLKKSSKPG